MLETWLLGSKLPFLDARELCFVFISENLSDIPQKFGSVTANVIISIWNIIT